MSSLREKQYNYQNARIGFFGDGGCGQTSLIRRLQGLPYVVDRPPSHNFLVTQEWLGTGPKVWTTFIDFAGQLVYKQIHQLFSSDLTLAVVVYRMDTEHNFYEFVDLCSNLIVRQEVPILLVGTKVDIAGPEPLPLPVLKERFPQVRGVYVCMYPFFFQCGLFCCCRF